MNTETLAAIWRDQHRSFRSLPLWVQLWVGWLVVINLVGAASAGTPTGAAVRRASLLFMPLNTALIVYERGWSSALSFTHLVAWPPLLVTLARRLRAPELGASERRLATAVLLTNAVSLAFDVVDAARWIRGERAVAGA